MDTARLALNRQLAVIDAHSRVAASEVQRATCIRAALLAGQVAIPSWAKAVARSMPGHRALQQAITGKLETLIKEQLQEVHKLPPEEQSQALHKLEYGEWQALRGEHARLHTFALRESQRLRSQIEHTAGRSGAPA